MTKMKTEEEICLEMLEYTEKVSRPERERAARRHEAAEDARRGYDDGVHRRARKQGLGFGPGLH